MNRCLFLLLFMLCATTMAMAQKYTYYYDAAGNRIQVLLFKSSEVASPADSIIERSAEVEFRLYPNPTKGLITLETAGIENGTRMICSIWNESGQLVMQQTVVNSHSICFDLSNRPNGFYILRLQYGGKQKSWNILKQ